MAWSGTARGSINDSVDRSTYSSGSYTPLADRLLVLFLHYGKDTGSATPPNCTVSGNGLTWQEVLTQGQANHRWSMWVAKTGASPSAGALSLAIGATQDYCQASIIEVEGADLSGTALAAIAQSKFGQFGQATSGSMALDAAPASTSRCVAMWVKFDTGGVTPRANWTEIHDLGLAGMGLETQMRVDAAEQTSSGSWVDDDWNQCLLAEIKGVAEGPTLISASDSPTLSVVEEAPVLQAGIAVSDTPSAGVTEAVTDFLAALSAADAPTALVTEAVDLLASFAVSDAPTVAVTDAAQLVVLSLILAADSPSVGVTEAVEILIGVPVSDSSSLILSEALDLLAPLSVADAPTLAATDTAQLVVLSLVTASDVPTIGLVELLEVAPRLAVADSPAVGTVGVAALLGSFVAADVSTVQVADAAGILLAFAAMDLATVLVVDSGQIAIIALEQHLVGPLVAVLSGSATDELVASTAKAEISPPGVADSELT
jgi:hypothetical protein